MPQGLPSLYGSLRMALVMRPFCMPAQFVDDEDVRLIGIEAGGEGVKTDKHAATLTMGSPGVLHGSFSYLLQDDEGQIIDPHSISAG